MLICHIPLLCSLSLHLKHCLYLTLCLTPSQCVLAVCMKEAWFESVWRKPCCLFHFSVPSLHCKIFMKKHYFNFRMRKPLVVLLLILVTTVESRFVDKMVNSEIGDTYYKHESDPIVSSFQKICFNE